MSLAPDGTAYTTIQRADGLVEVMRVKPHGFAAKVGQFATMARAQHFIFEMMGPRSKELPGVIT